MKNVTVTWDLPTELTDGTFLSEADILHVKVDMSADAGDNWSELDIILADAEQKVFIPELEKGDWTVALTVVLIDGRESQVVPVPFNVPSAAPPNEVANIQVTME